MTPAAARVPWRNGVLQEFDNLGRWFAGRYSTELSPSDESVPASVVQDLDVLRQMIGRCGASTSSSTLPGMDGRPAELGNNIEDVDLGVAVSRFTRHYVGSATTAALVGLSRGVGFDLSIDRYTMLMKSNVTWSIVMNLSNDEIVRCAEKPAAWDVSGPVVDTMAELRAFTWRKLYAENVWPVLEAAAKIGKISPNVVWTNAAEWVANVYNSAIEYLDPEAAEPYVTETKALLEAPTLPGVPSDTNPLADKIEYLPGDGKGFPEEVETRKACCLTYLLDDRFGRLCSNCPYLPLPDRIALVREQHGVPMGTQGGAATQRSIERGLSRPSTRRVRKAKNQDS